MSRVSAVQHVRKALAARQYDGHDPKDVSDAYEIEEGVELPQGMMVPGAGLLYWVGYGSADYDTEAQTRYIATTTLSVVITAPRKGGERSSAVAERVERWFIGAMSARPVSSDGVILAQPETLGLAAVTQTDRRGGRCSPEPRPCSTR